MYCLTLLDIVTFILSIVFFFTTFRQDDCYTDSCPKSIKLWLVISFLNLYAIQFGIFSYFKTKSRKISFLVWAFVSFLMLP
jgi:hypothetical protein